MIVSNIALPDPTPEGALWMLVPVGSEGVRLVMREATVHPDASFHDHPLSSLGEEIDALVLFEDVFVPRWRICSYRWTDLGKNYGQIGALEHWHTLTKLSVKADLFVGLVQLICDGIGTSHRPGVRQLIAEVIEHAQVLRGMVLASEDNAQLTDSGVMWPDWQLVTAGRSYALSKHPHIVHLVQELCGQGPILRWSEKDLDNPVIGPRIEWFYEGAAMSARDKNKLMNLVWDLTTSSHAGRVRLFENVNGFPVPYLRERMYLEYDRNTSMDFIRNFLDLEAGGSA
jgi:4-hydroxyphenylacetate 3-monooxygenase